MRIALLSDIHGNFLALDAVLKDIEAQGGVDSYWVLGDLVAIGPEPVRVLETLLALPNAVFTRGNTDRYVVTGERPSPFDADVKRDLTLLPLYQEVNNCFAWAQGAITGAGYFSWLSGLSLEYRYTLPEGTRCLGVHASPGQDDGRGLNPTSTKQEIQDLVEDCKADIIFIGHTHSPFDTMFNNLRIVNLGSLSNPHPPDLRASYVILEANNDAYQLSHRRVDYDHAAVIADCEKINHPSKHFIRRHLLGQVTPPWLKK